MLHRTFAALGDPNRLAIVERLLASGELNAGELTTHTPLSQPAVSRHLKVLRQAEIVNCRVDQQRRLYSVRPEAVQTLSAWAGKYREFWESSLDRLSIALDQEGENNDDA